MITGDLIKSALRKLGAFPSGSELDASEAQDALLALRQMYLEMVGNGMFGRQCDVVVPANAANFTARDGSRIVAEDLMRTTITLPEMVSDGWLRFDYGRMWCPPAANAGPPYSGKRPPRDGALVTAADLATDETRTYVYDAALARWTDLANLNIGDPAPLSTRYGEGLACELAIRLAPEYNQEPSAAIVRGAAQGRSAMVCRFDGPERAVRGQYY